MTLNRVGLALKRIGDAPADVYLDANNSLSLVQDAEAVGQHVRTRLMAYEGEWFLDSAVGLPWVRDILGGLYDPILAEAVIKAEILDTDGVTDISSFSVSFSRQTRGLSVFDIEVNTEYDIEVSV
ncbi:baseplate assembly protein W [Rhizobium phage RHph_I72]|nr:baseplate assembly protein W [Rhizobium phage RHph_I65]QIG76500.1 baseplate assembly protein W [Rhizobium phage RHph_I72]